jgi:hypothetical protein
MRKIFCLFLILAVAASAFSQSITIGGYAPKSTDSTTNGYLQQAYNELRNELQNMIGGINAAPHDLIRAFGNASVYASHGATQRAYGGYKSFAVTLGPTFGFQLPVSPFEVMDYISGDPLEGLYNKGDITFGLNPQIINAQIGFNSSFLLKGLYLGLRVGYVPEALGDIMAGFVGGGAGLKLSFSNLLVGVTANYQLVQSVDIIKGLITWRGVNVGTGFIFQNTNLNIKYPFDPITSDEGSVNLKIDPSLFLDMKITTFTIPLEITTAIKLIFLNIPIGVGVDFAFGSSKIDIGIDSNIAVTGGIGKITPGKLNATAGGDENPTFANFKLMTGIGLSIGPVIIDIPITWYFLDNGLSIGVTLGMTW